MSSLCNDIFHLFAKASIRFLPRFDARCLSSLAYAYALVNYIHVFDDGSTLFDHIEWHATRQLRIFNPQSLTDIVWAFAKLDVHHPHLFDQVAVQAVAKKSGFDVQQVAILLWAFAVSVEADGPSHFIGNAISLHRQNSK